MAEDFPDFTRAVRLLGVDEAGDLVTVLVDSAGNLGAIVKGLAPGDVLTAVAVDAGGRIVMVPYGTVTVAGTATVTQSAKDREVQGADGETLRTLAVDTYGQLVMVPRGQTGNYMSVDDDGYLSAILKGVKPGPVYGTVALDADGQIIMVPRGQSGYYLAVDANGYMGAILKAAADVNVQGSVPVDQNAKDREMQGAEGENLHTVAVDATGQIIMVPRGQSGYYMAVDDNGYMTAVLKGVRDSVLTTIGVDAQGRIEAFGLDAEDQWGQTLKVGNADLVGRLGSPVTWDWRGNVYYIHDFSTGIPPCFTSPVGDYSEVAVTPERGGYGGYSLKLTAGNAEGDATTVQLPVGINPGSRVGVAARFSIYSNTAYVRLMLERWKSAHPPVGYARINVASKTVEVYDASTGWESLGAVPTSLGSYTFSWFKLVIDQATGKYERVLYNDTYYDASAYTCPDSVVASEGVMAVSVVNYSRTGATDIVYLDQIVLTVNEPANPPA